MADAGSPIQFMFRPRPHLGRPLVFAPAKQGCVSASVQFLIPGLALAKSDEAAVIALSTRLGVEQVCDCAMERHVAQPGGQPATLVAIAFRVPESGGDDQRDSAINNTAVLIVERFMGALSFQAGMRLTALYSQTTRVAADGTASTRLDMAARAEGSKRSIRLSADPFNGQTPSESIFTALFWLRRGLAERDPLDTYAALMVSLQAIAREVVGPQQVEKHCPKCSAVLSSEGSVSSMVRQLVVGSLGASPEVFSRLWKARNAVVAHGNTMVTADTFLELTELKFEAATLCYRGINLAMGIMGDDGPQPDQMFFATSALMYVD